LMPFMNRRTDVRNILIDFDGKGIIVGDGLKRNFFSYVFDNFGSIQS